MNEAQITGVRVVCRDFLDMDTTRRCLEEGQVQIFCGPKVVFESPALQVATPPEWTETLIPFGLDTPPDWVDPAGLLVVVRVEHQGVQHNWCRFPIDVAVATYFGVPSPNWGPRRRVSNRTSPVKQLVCPRCGRARDMGMHDVRL